MKSNIAVVNTSTGKQLFEVALNHVSVPLCIINSNYELKYSNKQFIDLIGEDFFYYWPEETKSLLFSQEQQEQLLEFQSSSGKPVKLTAEIKKINISGETFCLIQLPETESLIDNPEKTIHEESFQLGIWLWDIAKNKVIRSKELLKIYKRDSSHKEVSFNEHLLIYPEGIRNKIEKKLVSISKGKKEHEFEEVISLPGGELHYLKTKVILIDDASGDIKKIAFSCIDISAYKLSERKLIEQKSLLQDSLNLTDNLYKLERDYVLGKGESREKIYKAFLDTIVEYTNSEFGFLGEIKKDKDNHPYLKIYAISDVVWNEHSRQMYKGQGIKSFEFRNMDNLFGHTITTGKTVITNNPKGHSASKGLPKGHPELKTYLGVPLHKKNELVGMIALANAKGGYSEITLKRIKPFISSLLLMIEFSRLEEQRNEHEKRIKQNEERLEKIFDVLNAPILICEPDTFKFKFFNQNVVHKLGFSEAELYQMTLYDFEVNEDFTRLNVHIKSVLTNKAAEFNTQWKTKNGEAIEVLLKASFIELGNKEYILFAGYDITRQAEVYLALKEEQKRFKELFESVPVGILTANKEGEITTCNSVCAEMFGYSQEEMPFISVNDLIANNFSREKHQALMEGYLEKPESRKMLASARGVVGKKKNGNKIPVEVSLSHFETEGNKQVIAIITDISEKEEAVQTKKMLDERETLLKEIHHRVKNNMQVISSLLSLQSAKVTDPEALLKFKESEARIKSMALIHEKLYESESLTEINVKEYLEDLIDHVVGSYTLSQQVSLVKNINKITLNIEQCIPFGLIVNEFLTNALKYAFHDGRNGTITIILEESKEGILLIVHDNGIGFSPSIEEKKTLGFRLIKSLTKQLKGRFLQENDNGAKCTLLFERQ